MGRYVVRKRASRYAAGLLIGKSYAGNVCNFYKAFGAGPHPNAMGRAQPHYPHNLIAGEQYTDGCTLMRRYFFVGKEITYFLGSGHAEGPKSITRLPATHREGEGKTVCIYEDAPRRSRIEPSRTLGHGFYRERPGV